MITFKLRQARAEARKRTKATGRKHGAVPAFDDDGNWIKDKDDVPLYVVGAEIKAISGVDFKDMLRRKFGGLKG